MIPVARNRTPVLLFRMVRSGAPVRRARADKSPHEFLVILTAVQVRNPAPYCRVPITGGSGMKRLLLTSAVFLGTILTGCAGGGYYASARMGPPPPPRYGVM